jgi:hypothetical protein
MAANLSRWFGYARAKLNDLVASGHRDLDELEAERAAEVADRPWLADDGANPTFEQTKARIDWEADAQQRAGRSQESTPPAGDMVAGQPSAEPPTEDPDVAAARLELDRQARESQARLAAIRKELGVDPDAGPPSPER